MSKLNFDLAKLKVLSPIDAKKYIDDYFIPLTDGNHAFYRDGNYDILDDSVLKRTYFKRMNGDLNKYYFTEKIDLRTITYDINKPQLYDSYLNLCPKIKQEYKEYKLFDNSTKASVNIILNHILEVWCSSNKESYNFVLKWLSNMIKGNRNDSCLYLKGAQGLGKSTPLEFIRAHVIGNKLSFQGGSGPLKSKFNSELSGKLMVMFEELENFSSTEWISISSILKRQITSPTLMIEAKGKDPREETNLNNYILLSNNDAIQDDDGRRYFILDISAKYLGNRDYFNNLYSCFNDTVGQAFYSYLKEVDTSKFNPQAYPMTKSKLDSFSKRLDNVYKFLKDEYILRNRGISRITVADLYAEFCLYCGNNKKKGKIDFNSKLEEINIKYYGSSNKNYYKVSYEDLKAISDKFHWVHALDEIEEPQSVKSDEDLEAELERLMK